MILVTCKLKKFLQDFKMSFSCSASLYLLCSAQANDSTAIYIFSFLEKVVKEELVMSLFMIVSCYYL